MFTSLIFLLMLMVYLEVSPWWGLLFLIAVLVDLFLVCVSSSSK